MDESIIKEDLSICYISAVSANAGIDYETLRHDADSTDGIVKKCIDLPELGLFNSEIRIQLKSTSSASQYEETETDIKYHLKVKNYNDLCQRGTSPIILCLLILPPERDKWMEWSREELVVRGCMYWTSLANSGPSSNKGSVTVTFDKNNIVNSTTLQDLLEKVAREEALL